MPKKYEVVTQCYVPVGPGFRYKKPGQVVTLKAADANEAVRLPQAAGRRRGCCKTQHPGQAGAEPPSRPNLPRRWTPMAVNRIS